MFYFNGPFGVDKKTNYSYYSIFSTKAKIAAIEAKLRQMEDDSSYHSGGHVSLKQISSTSTAIVGQVYSAAKGRPAKQGHNLKQYRPNKPYSRTGIRTRK